MQSAGRTASKPSDWTPDVMGFAAFYPSYGTHSPPIHKTKVRGTQIRGNRFPLLSLLARAMLFTRRIPMNNRFLISVAAAALIAGTGFANAQGSGQSREAPSAGATQQSSPPTAATPSNRDSSQSGAPAEAPKSAQSKDMAPK